MPAPTGFLRGVQCSTPLPAALPDPLAAAFRSAYAPTGARPREDLGAASVLRVLSINCGGAVGGPARLTALLVYADPDVVCLQEAASMPQSLGPDLSYRRWCGPPVRGGGLVTLVHRRLLPARAKPDCLSDCPACLCVTVELSGGAVLSVVNLHLPPGTSAATRKGIYPPLCRPSGCPVLAPLPVLLATLPPPHCPPPLRLPSVLRWAPLASLPSYLSSLGRPPPRPRPPPPPRSLRRRGAGVFWRPATTGGAGRASSCCAGT